MGNRPEGLIRHKKEEKEKEDIRKFQTEHSPFQLKRKTDQMCVG
jgi:hypothetical protein